MNRANKSQKDKVAQFRAITGASERQALQRLQVCNVDSVLSFELHMLFAGGLS